MRIRSTVGFGMFLLILSIAMPAVFAAFEATLLSVLHAVQTTVEQAETLTAAPMFALPVPHVEMTADRPY